MKLLLDTCAFLWFIRGDPNLSQIALQEIQAPGNVCYVSIASLWEMAIKAGLGRLQLNMTMPELVRDHVKANAMSVLSIKPTHLECQRNLPLHHRDPFDRLLLAQALTDHLTLISCDHRFPQYGVQLIW